MCPKIDTCIGIDKLIDRLIERHYNRTNGRETKRGPPTAKESHSRINRSIGRRLKTRKACVTEEKCGFLAC